MTKQLLALLILSSGILSAQTSRFYQKDLLAFADAIYLDTNDVMREAAAMQYEIVLDSILNNPRSFQVRFDSVKNLSVMTAPDGRFRLYTWCRPKLDGTYAFYGFAQIKPKNGEPFHIKLEESRLSPAEAPKHELGVDQWYGALYYEIIMHKQRKKKYYTLLGWRQQDALETQKIVEVVTISRQDEITFGAKNIELAEKEKPVNRYILRFNAEVYTSLKYEKRANRIVMDHLAPSNPDMEGLFQTYGPDLSYDALNFKKGKWILSTDVEARNRNN